MHGVSFTALLNIGLGFLCFPPLQLTVCVLLCFNVFHYLILSDQCLQLYGSEQLVKAVLHKFCSSQPLGGATKGDFFTLNEVTRSKRCSMSAVMKIN